MPGIVGFIRRDYVGSQSEPNPLVHRLVQPLQHLPSHTTHTANTSIAAIASVQIDQEPRLVQKKGIILAYAGEIVEQEKIREQVRGQTGGNGMDIPFVDVLAELYLNEGPASLCGFNGLYTLAVWDEAQQRLSLVNDRYGIQKLYTYSDRDIFLFSSELKSIIQYPYIRRKMSLQAAVDLLCLEHMLDERTLFEDVQLLPPATLLTAKEGRVQIERYWNFAFEPPNSRRLTVDQYVDGLAERAQAAVARRMAPGSCLLLTGGLDSRLVAGMYQKNRPETPVHAISLGHAQAADVLDGQEIARRLGFLFTNVSLTSHYIADLAEQTVWITEGNMNLHAGWILAANPYFQEHDIHYALTGIGGEAAAGRHKLLETLNPNTQQALAGFCENFPKVQRLLKPGLGEELVQGSLASLQAALQHAPAQNPLNQLDYVSYYQSLRRHATSVDVFADTVHPLDPLLDNDLIDYVQGIPPELRAGGFLYKKMIRKHLPLIAPVGIALRGPILPPRWDRRLNKNLHTVRRVQRRLKRLAGSQPSRAGDRPENYIHPNAWLREGSRDYALGVLSQAADLDNLLNLDAVKDLVNDHLSGKRNEFQLICGLMTLIIWHRQFELYSPAPASIQDYGGEDQQVQDQVGGDGHHRYARAN